MTSEQHNKYVAYTFLGYAGIQMLIALAMMVFFFVMVFGLEPNPGDASPPAALFGFMGVFFFIFYAIFTAPAVVAAWALLKKKPWARVAGIVGAVVSAMSVPFGTAACVYALWFFLGEHWKEVYETPSPTSRASLSGSINLDDTKWSGIRTGPDGDIVAEPVQKPDWR